jgi:hypothetical protein
MNIAQARNSSKAFKLAYGRCMEELSIGFDQSQILVVPAIVCAAFSVELGFKTLLLLSNVEARGHEINKLFAKIPARNQDAIVEGVGIERGDFDAALVLVANAFTNWRYIYEKTDDVHIDIDFLRKLAAAIQDEIDAVAANPVS